MPPVLQGGHAFLLSWPYQTKSYSSISLRGVRDRCAQACGRWGRQLTEQANHLRRGRRVLKLRSFEVWSLCVAHPFCGHKGVDQEAQQPSGGGSSYKTWLPPSKRHNMIRLAAINIRVLVNWSPPTPKFG